MLLWGNKNTTAIYLSAFILIKTYRFIFNPMPCQRLHTGPLSPATPPCPSLLNILKQSLKTAWYWVATSLRTSKRPFNIGCSTQQMPPGCGSAPWRSRKGSLPHIMHHDTGDPLWEPAVVGPSATRWGAPDSPAIPASRKATKQNRICHG